MEELLKRVADLERRVLSLEGKLYHKGGFARVVRHVVSRWPGQFTSRCIEEAVFELQPELRQNAEAHQTSVVMARMERAGEIIKVEAGCGPNPNLYERAVRPPEGAGRWGPRTGRPHSRESGFRNVVRSAISELQEPWTIEDLRRWVAEKAPSARVPYGSWSSTLYKMTMRKELEVLPRTQWLHTEGKDLRGKRRLKLYKRGPRMIGLSGDVIGELEKAWREFRAQIQLPPEASGDWEFDTPLKRSAA